MNRNIFHLIVGTSFLVLILCSLDASAETTESNPSQNSPAPPDEEFKRLEVVFEPDAYYTDLDVIIALTKAPIPNLGEQSESEIYATLLSRAAILPQFLVIEASINPMPYLGTYIRKHSPGFYADAQISGSFNWVKALTAGFEEPYAFSLLAGNVANFYLTGSGDAKGLGYSGYLFSMGNYHIKDNEMIQDDWREFEWKIKGDRKSPVKKLSWSFRAGAKLHGNPDITDTLYLKFRRSRIDYKPEHSSFFNNSGFEYTVDMDRKSLTPIQHYFYVDKKWPVKGKQIAVALAAGFIWESAGKYKGPLAREQGTNFQFLLRPNIEF